MENALPGQDRLVERRRAVHPGVLPVLRVRFLGRKLLMASGTRRTLMPIFSQSRATASITSGPSSA